MSGDRCFTEVAPEDGGPPLVQHGDLFFQAHHVGWIVTAFFTVIATTTSFWLVYKHLRWYTNKREQRYIVRLLFMVPIYAIISLASYIFWNHHTPLLLIRDCYESTVLTSFFYLLLTYLSLDPESQKAIFLKAGLSRQADREARKKGEPVSKWMFPLGFVKWKPEDGLYFLQLMKYGVLQYCVIRPLTTLASVILDYFGLYCEDSWSIKWGHPYITVVVSISVSIAMFCLVQLYMPVAAYLKPHEPLLKLFSVKAIVFLTFWQATLLGLLSTFKVIKDTRYMTADDISVGFSAILETFEMMIFAFLHIKAFSYKPYTRSSIPPRFSGLRALGHAFDFRETFREIGAGAIYALDRSLGREPRPDIIARRSAYLEEALGKHRLPLLPKPTEDPATEASKLEVEVSKSIDVDVGGERQWLGLGDDYIYGLGYARREKSDGLGQEIAKELQRRGFDTDVLYRDAQTEQQQAATERSPGHREQSSFWRGLYRRMSQLNAAKEDAKLTPTPSKRISRSRRQSRHIDHSYSILGYDYDDLPPPSAMRTHRNQSRRQSNDSDLYQVQEHVPASYEGPRPDRTVLPISPDVPITTTHRAPFPIANSNSPLVVHYSPPTYLNNVFASGVVDHEVTSESGLQSPLSASVPFSGLVLSQPPTPRTVMVSSGHHYKSEIGHVQGNLQLHSMSPASAVAEFAQIDNEPSVSPPPVPPKSSSQDTHKGPPPRRTSHRRESAFYNSTVPIPSSPTPGSRTPASAHIPNPAIATSRSPVDNPPSTRDFRNTIPNSFVPTTGNPSELFGKAPTQDPFTSVIPPNASGSLRSSALIHNNPKRPRQHSLPVPVPSAPHTIPPLAYSSHLTGNNNRRMSAPLEIIPQHSVPTSYNRTSHHSRHSLTTSRPNYSPPEIGIGSSRYRTPINQSPPRRPIHIPRVPIMPQPLSPPHISGLPQSDFPRTESLGSQRYSPSGSPNPLYYPSRTHRRWS